MVDLVVKDTIMVGVLRPRVVAHIVFVAHHLLWSVTVKGGRVEGWEEEEGRVEGWEEEEGRVEG